MISLLIDIEEEGEVLTEEELYAQCIALLFAGHETTRNLIGNGMYTLLQHPQEAAELRETGDDPFGCEELLPAIKPVQFTARRLQGRYRGLRASRYGRAGRSYACSVRRTGIQNNLRNRIS